MVRSLLKGHTDAVRCLAFAPGGGLLAPGSSDASVRLWEMATGRERAILKGHADWVLAVAVTPDGRVLATGSRDRTVKLWDISALDAQLLGGRGA